VPGLCDRLLAESLAPNQTLSIGTLPIPFLEAGDPVTLVSEQGYPTADYLINKTTCRWTTAAWTAEMLSANDTLAEAA
jgi:hypothetical protein